MYFKLLNNNYKVNSFMKIMPNFKLSVSPMSVNDMEEAVDYYDVSINDLDNTININKYLFIP